MNIYVTMSSEGFSGSKGDSPVQITTYHRLDPDISSAISMTQCVLVLFRTKPLEGEDYSIKLHYKLAMSQQLSFRSYFSEYIP
jgi:hypothetical protein